MVLSYKVVLEDGIFKYKCSLYSSYLKIRMKDIKKIYNILNKLDVIYEQTEKTYKKNIVYRGFEIIFENYRCIKIEKVSNWLMIKDEVPIIKRELRKYIKEYGTEYIKDIIIKIKSLKRGSNNRIKEDLKWEKLLFQEK